LALELMHAAKAALAIRGCPIWLATPAMSRSAAAMTSMDLTIRRFAARSVAQYRTPGHRLKAKAKAKVTASAPAQGKG
jgi:hypothetical protein